jgi:hypothetical protein
LEKQKSDLNFSLTSSPDYLEKVKSTYEGEIKLLNKELMIFKETEHQLVVEKEKVAIENQKLHRIMEEGNK